MQRRKYIFPNVIELNYQAGRRLGVNVYLIDGDNGDYVLIDIGFEDSVDDIVELIRQMDFSLSKCQAIIATHADAVAQYRAGKTQTFGFLVGQVMKGSRGKANPQVANQLLKRELG